MSDYREREREAFGRVVEWVGEALPHAIAWAEADLLATRRARRYHADLAVRTGQCAVGHQWRVAAVTGTSCGYCLNAAEHSRLWRPPVSAPRVPDHLAPPAP